MRCQGQAIYCLAYWCQINKLFFFLQIAAHKWVNANDDATQYIASYSHNHALQIDAPYRALICVCNRFFAAPATI